MFDITANIRYQRYRRIVGVLVIASILLILFALWTATRHVGFFSEEYSLMGFIDSVDSVKKNTPVTLAGLEVGKVSHLEITRTNRIQLELLIAGEYKDKIRRDSFALIKTDILGNSRIDISIGSPEQPILQDKAQIAFQKVTDFDVILTQAKQRLEQVSVILEDIKEITHTLKQPNSVLYTAIQNIADTSKQLLPKIEIYLEQTDIILHNVAEITAQLKKPDSQIFKVLDNLSTSSADLKQTITNIAQISQRIKQGEGLLGELTRANSELSRTVTKSLKHTEIMLQQLRQLSAQSPEYAKQVEKILQHLEATTAELHKASPQLPDLLKQSNQILSDVDDTVDSMKKSILLRAFTTPHQERVIIEVPRDLIAPSPTHP